MKRMMTVLLLFTALILSMPVSAQKLVADVTIILERLPLINQERMADLKTNLENYINDYDWREDDSYEQPITIQIYLMDASTSYEDRYAGTFLISNGSDLQYHDKYWRFPLQEGYQLEHSDDVFDPFTGFIDFYVYLILAAEEDKYGKFFGTKIYEKSRQLSDQALFNAQFAIGWEERQELIQFLMGEENKPFRAMKDLYFLGLSYWGEDNAKTLQYCKQAVSMLEKVLQENEEHEGAIQFVKAHHIELIEVFQEAPDVIRQLIRIDPERKATYEKYL